MCTWSDKGIKDKQGEALSVNLLILLIHRPARRIAIKALATNSLPTWEVRTMAMSMQAKCKE